MRSMFSVAPLVLAFSVLLGQSAAFAGNAEIDKMVKGCEQRAAQRGISGRICACVPKKMNEAGFSDEEILKYSKSGFKPKGIVETDRYFDYSMKLRLMPGQCPV